MDAEVGVAPGGNLVHASQYYRYAPSENFMPPQSPKNAAVPFGSEAISVARAISLGGISLCQPGLNKRVRFDGWSIGYRTFHF